MTEWSTGLASGYRWFDSGTLTGNVTRVFVNFAISPHENASMALTKRIYHSFCTTSIPISCEHKILLSFHCLRYYDSPNVLIQLRIRDVPGSNFGPDPGYLNRLFMDFLNPSWQISRSYLKYATKPSFRIISNSLFINRPIKWRHTV